MHVFSGFSTKHLVCTMLKNSLPTIVASAEPAIFRQVRNLCGAINKYCYGEITTTLSFS